MEMGKNSAAQPRARYVPWYRTKFFEKKYKKKLIVLIVEDIETIERYIVRFEKPLKFEIVSSFGHKINNSLTKNIIDFIRSKSSFINLVVEGITRLNIGKKSDLNEISQKSTTTYSEFSSETKRCFTQFKEDYKNDFILVSIIDDSIKNKKLLDFALENNINFYCNFSINIPENKIKGVGHLNIKGNRELALFLYESIKKYYSKNTEE